MASLESIVNYCNRTLVIDQFKDYSPNGLQIEGNAEVNCIVAGVTASAALIDAAIEHKADLLLVHHGYFWQGEDPCLVGMKGRRVSALIKNNMSLLAYHLPLDAHQELGNNAQLAQLFDLTVDDKLDKQGVGNIGHLSKPMRLSDFSEKVAVKLAREPLVISGGDHLVSKVGWCSGGAQKYLSKAAAMGVDTFLSGEISENTTHEARELGIHYLAAGHHATERYGVRALAEQLGKKFNLSQYFIDIANPV
ncbi:MAG: Nif3-like dinuclear metal center hexameric protein [Thiotrichaceae bacterium]|nr:Nif3-like dinuclear metal center hexameric protein [Thiotrichaceae bacterium]